jgi:hypothetical protein
VVFVAGFVFGLWDLWELRGMCGSRVAYVAWIRYDGILWLTDGKGEIRVGKREEVGMYLQLETPSRGAKRSTLYSPGRPHRRLKRRDWG